jgi:hypothetical protein
VNYGRVVEVLAIMRGAGVGNIGLVAEPEDVRGERGPVVPSARDRRRLRAVDPPARGVVLPFVVLKAAPECVVAADVPGGSGRGTAGAAAGRCGARDAARGRADGEGSAEGGDARSGEGRAHQSADAPCADARDAEHLHQIH